MDSCHLQKSRGVGGWLPGVQGPVAEDGEKNERKKGLATYTKRSHTLVIALISLVSFIHTQCSRYSSRLMC